MATSDLVVRAQAGDELAFAALLAPSRNRAWSVCLRITGNHADAEDALQDALTAAWRGLDRFRGEANFSTWLYRIAANAALAVVRRRHETLPDNGLELWAAPDSSSEIDERDRVQRGLAQLSAEHRTILVLREYGELSYQELAEAQGLPVQTVKSRLNRARAAFAAALTEQGDFTW